MFDLNTDELERDVRIGLSLVLCLILGSLAGCVYFVNLQPEKPIYKRCDVFKPPLLKPIPKVVVLTEKELNNSDLADTALVNNIKELREWGLETERQYSYALERHRESCN